MFNHLARDLRTKGLLQRPAHEQSGCRYYYPPNNLRRWALYMNEEAKAQRGRECEPPGSKTGMKTGAQVCLMLKSLTQDHTTQLSTSNQCYSLLFLSPSLWCGVLPSQSTPKAPPPEGVSRSPGFGNSQNSTVLIPPHLTPSRICSIRFSCGPGCCRWSWWRWGALSRAPSTQQEQQGWGRALWTGSTP